MSNGGEGQVLSTTYWNADGQDCTFICIGVPFILFSITLSFAEFSDQVGILMSSIFFSFLIFNVQCFTSVQNLQTDFVLLRRRC